ncbi:DUF4440 domain-containing protein [Arthrobacter sp. MYb211]|uniref:ribonuclease HI family protein n=1 Tax=unclassified Arthrobacter TaxID=235627 RepID=UPI000CFC9A2A|nr:MULTISPECIES: ribonuclease HI family protein [unclassified Arthrobacter]PRA08300.1 DUF4440 domain-containing protein [Arthrobacter sp. MYb221]PRC02984.1 DUF4440 domain-containing protein [Arthrobacter sp. MYb211]
MTIIAAADGSALGNPGPAGWAWYIDHENWGAGGWDHGTNNMGELQAVLELFRATAKEPETELKILCDSQYAINCITKWMPGWKKKGWKKSDGKPVLNQDILRELDAVIVGRKYTFEWVKGHAGHELNEEADDRARAAATAHQSGKDPDAGPGYTGSSGTIAGNEPGQAPPPVVEAAAEPAVDVASTVFELEQGLLDAQVRANFTEVSDFLHPSYQEVCRDGSLLDVSTVRSILDAGGALPATGPVQLLTARPLDSKLVLIAYRMSPEGSQVLVCSSWWQQTERGWKLRFRQETIESHA